MLSIYTELDFIALIGSLSGASKISSKSATPRIINNRQQQSSNGHECVQFQFLIGCLDEIIFDKVNVVEMTGGFINPWKNNAILRESWGDVDCTEYRSAIHTGS